MVASFEYMVVWFAENIPQPIRLIMALGLGIIIYMVTDHAHDVTNASTMFAEMFHAAGDIVEILTFWIALMTIGNVGRMVAKISGAIVMVGGLVPLYKGLTGIYTLVQEGVYVVKDLSTLFITSLAIIVLLLVQILLIANEHSHEHEHVGDSHSALMAHFWTDLFLTALALLLAAVMFVAPHWPQTIAGFDILFTLIIGAYMVYRGYKIVFKKKTSHTHDDHAEHGHHHH